MEPDSVSVISFLTGVNHRPGAFLHSVLLIRYFRPHTVNEVYVNAWTSQILKFVDYVP